MDRLVYVGEEGEVASGPRQRLIDSAIAMMRERGVHATGLADLLKRSGTARNSIYQHFPEGKAELIAAAEREASDLANGFLDALRARGDAEYLLTRFIAWWVNQLEAHDFDTGCPHAAAALAGPGEEQIRAAAHDAFIGMRPGWRSPSVTRGWRTMSTAWRRSPSAPSKVHCCRRRLPARCSPYARSSVS
ncbi:Putative transcriptional regulator%2C TetR family [Mycobacteroides abscessus]|nr:Putative transcriptional regulator%2C TetR family [Mycobacteroides abscessus]